MSRPIKRQKTNRGAAVPNLEKPEFHLDHQLNEQLNEHLDHSKSSTLGTSSALGEKDPRTVFVRNLSSDVTTQILASHFSQSYPIKHAVAVLDKITKSCKGYGFVTFADKQDAQHALSQLDGSLLLGRTIKVESAQVRHRMDGGLPIIKPPKEQTKSPAPKLIIRNLPWSINSVEKLSHLFLSFGKVKEAILPKGPSGKLMGFGIIILRGKKNAERAVQAMNGKQIDGRTLAVDWAADKDTWEKSRKDQIKSADVHASDLATDATEEPQTSLQTSSASQDDSGATPEDSPHSSDLSSTGDDMSDTGSDKSDMTPKKRFDTTDSTIFVRNLPFSFGDQELAEHFETFGSVRYARVVYDPSSEQSRGTGFVCFVRKVDADACLKEAPRTQLTSSLGSGKSNHSSQTVLQDEASDPTGRYTLDGRVVIVSQAVQKDEAERLRQDGVDRRNIRDKDRRRLFLLNEGKITSKSPMFEKLSPSERALRDASAKQRAKLVEMNPSLHLSLTRLSIRNIPRSVTSKDLKALARKAVAGFAEDVKSGVRDKLSKEELARGGDAMRTAEHRRKLKKSGVVKQAKVVFESKEGSKVQEAGGAGRSRGYGFIEYHTHRTALMGLRWLNGREIDSKELENVQRKSTDTDDRKRRLIVEFALENVNVVNRRQDRERKPPKSTNEAVDDVPAGNGNTTSQKSKPKHKSNQRPPTQKSESHYFTSEGRKNTPNAKPSISSQKGGKLADRQRIIARKRMARRARKG